MPLSPPGGFRGAVTNYGSDSVYVFRPCYEEVQQSPQKLLSFRETPKELPGSPFTGGGLRGPAGIVIDGAANAWIANNAQGANSISEIAIDSGFHSFAFAGMPLSPQNGFTGAGLNRPLGIAIDSAGDVWVTNHNANSLTVFIGVANAPF
jgi:hypothetical protein